ncbi:MAG: DUF2690 domain-containing protein [Caldilineales bacterium]|nr:DUF2690 domain-containing protein [Caldilineales bacterium]
MTTTINLQALLRRRLLFLALMALAAGLLLLAVLPIPADAGGYPTCHGKTCRGEDPVETGCYLDAVTLDIIPQPGTAGAGYNQYVELRYSRNCDASWSRVQSRLGKGDILFTQASVKGHFWDTYVKRTGKMWVTSRMWSGLQNACGLSVWTEDPTYRPYGCTDYD